MADSSSSRFVAVNVDCFIEEKKNDNTKRKTESDLRLFRQYLKQVHDTEEDLETIEPERLDAYMAEFFVAVRKPNGRQYEPLSLRSFFASFCRYLKGKRYPEQLTDSALFNKSREALKAKQKELKSFGKGSKPNAARSLTDQEVDLLHESGEFGTHSARALVNMLWWNNTTQFGLRGCRENRDLCWGDVNLRKDSAGVEFLEYTERQTKTRSGENPLDLRKVKPTMWPCSDLKRDPIAAYKKFAEERPPKTCAPDSPFYLGIDHNRNPKYWFTTQPMGRNTINNLMKTMCMNAGIIDEEHKLSNHSARKTMVKKLKENQIPDTDIIQRDKGDSDSSESDIISDPDEEVDHAFEAEHAWRLQSLEWCKCGHCTLKPKAIEFFCCHEKALEYDEYDNLLNEAEANGKRCLTAHGDFQANMLSESVLEIDVFLYLEDTGLWMTKPAGRFTASSNEKPTQILMK
ncbi:uncharacterized protein LOC114536765 [Dendronephthya gigantea]|uniref:uncharacterized protein LOC114536765 n=1 Tax=Dendronephthya gigantea TaxID=151771 RepID=UPI00106A2333|nr:uncharacterized protein LOC114536765 [Dendronephthya gigantea]